MSYFAHGGEAGSLEFDGVTLGISIVFEGLDAIEDQVEAAQRFYAD